MTKRSATATLSALILTLSGAAAASAAPIVIDFESYIAGTVLAGGTDLGGVSIDQDIQIGPISPFPPYATGNQAATTGPGGFADDFSGTFTTAVNSFSLAVGDECCDLDDAVLSVFDADMNLLGTASFFDQPSGQVLTVIAVGIKFFSVDQHSLVVFDNLTFDVGEQTEPAPVPEPASLLLLGTGMTAIAIRARRRQR